MKNVSTEQYINFCKSFGHKNRDKNDLRFGQKFCNDFDIHNSELFYCEDINHAKLLAMQYIQ